MEMHILTFRSFLIFTLSLMLSTGATEKGYSIKISEIDFYPQTPQGGLNMSLYSKKSPLGSRDFGKGVYLSEKTSENLSLLKQPRKAKKAQKKADAKKKKQKEAIKEGSIEAQKRSFEIQTPDVQERMKQNKKDTAARDKAKRKSNKERTRRGAKKYK
jgi:hypothetical protein